MRHRDQITVTRYDGTNTSTIYEGRADVTSTVYGPTALVRCQGFLPYESYSVNNEVVKLRPRDWISWSDMDLTRTGEVFDVDRETNSFTFKFVDARQCLHSMEIHAQSTASAGGGAITKTYALAETVSAQLTEISFTKDFGRDIVYPAATFRVLFTKGTTTLTPEHRLYYSSREFRISEFRHGRDAWDKWYELIVRETV